MVMIIGAGRTGSSMLTRILIALGMSGSSNHVSAVEHNPEGVFEDNDIVNIHKNILSTIGVHAYGVVPDDFLCIDGVAQFIPKIKKIIKEKTINPEYIWGFKDPRSASLLPLWSRVFNPLKIAPKYVVTLRNPAAVVTSMHRQFNDDVGIAELVWLVRTCDALYYSGGNCFIVHYEDWFTDKANKLALNLSLFIGLEYDENKIQSLLDGIVKKSLNRSSYENYEILNPYVEKLYTVLKQCSGDDFDHEKLMKVVIECRQAIKSFTPWLSLSANTASRDQLEEINILNIDNSKLVVNLNKQLKEIKELQDRNKELEIKKITMSGIQTFKVNVIKKIRQFFMTD